MNKWGRFIYQPVLPLGKDGRRATGSREHIALSRYAASQGMVLLKNENGVLPLAGGSRVALFGKAVIDYVKGGGGSGDVTVEYVKNLAEGMLEKQAEGKIMVYEPLISFYREEVAKQLSAGTLCGQTVEPEIPEALLCGAAMFADTAVISICRFSGEGWDRTDSDFYLTEQENAMVSAVLRKFAKVAVVLNIGGMLDTSWFKNNDAVSSVLLGWQGGMEGAMAEADLLCGDRNPCGKLTDTFASCFDDYPSSAHFADSEDYVEYSEDIYMGYRYFETIPGAAEKVNYSFGYGLSYTDFETEYRAACECGDRIFFDITVTNVGKRSGKETVMIYVSAPQGKLGKPAKELKAFAKTRELEPGETQLLRLKVEKDSLASYDDTGKAVKSAWILEAGEYRFFYGNDVSRVRECAYSLRVPETVIVEQAAARCVPSALAERMLPDGTMEKMPAFEGEKPVPFFEDWLKAVVMPGQKEIPPLQLARFPEDKPPKRPMLTEVADGEITADEFIASLSDEELCNLAGGQPNVGPANTWGIGNLPQAGIPNVMTADGPAGLRIRPEVGICTTAWPCATLIACSFDEALAEQIGRAGGLEVKENNIAVWLTPAMNIHRTPLCGRNFEYYSEDPFVAGKIGAAMVRGIQSNHIGASVKHFACNNKETNRKNSDSRLSERALREIYLKGFEITVKESDPWTIMSSYNIINGIRASENKDLLTGILREEWGFQGMVTTDWWNFALHEKEILAGNDLKMPIGAPDRLLDALKEGKISREDVEICVRRILGLLLKLD